MHITDVVSSVGIFARVWACFCKHSPTLCHHEWQARLCSRPGDGCSQQLPAGHPCEATQAVGSQEHRVLGQAGCSGLAAEVQRRLGHGDELAATTSQLDACGEGLGLQLPHEHEGRVPSMCANFRRHPGQGPHTMNMYDPTQT